MLSKSLKRAVQHWYTYTCFAKEQDGKPVGSNGELIDLPTYPEMIASSIKELNALAEGESKVTRVHPSLANCILRIYSTYHKSYGDNLVYNVYGALCYVRTGGGWVTSWTGTDEVLKIDFEHFKTKRWLCQDESFEFDHDFVDVFLNIS